MIAPQLEAMHVRFNREPPNMQLCSSQYQDLSLAMRRQYDVFHIKLVHGFSTVHTMLFASNFGIKRAMKAYAPITGYSRFTRNYCTHRPAAMPERKRPSSGLARVTAYAKPPKQRRPSASGTSFSDWIGGTCQADTLQVWFPAHWAPVVLQQLQDKYRAEHPSWMDEKVAPADIPKQWQEVRANRRMQFKVSNYRDGSGESNIRLLTGTIKAD